MVGGASVQKEKKGTTKPSQYFTTVLQIGVAGLAVNDDNNASLILLASSGLRKLGSWNSFSSRVHVNRTYHKKKLFKLKTLVKL